MITAICSLTSAKMNSCASAIHGLTKNGFENRPTSAQMEKSLKFWITFYESDEAKNIW